MDSAFVDQIIETGGGWLWGVGGLVGAAVLGLLLHAVLSRLARRLHRRAAEERPLWDAAIRRLSGPLRLLVPVLLAYAVLPVFRGRLPTGVGAGLEGIL